MGLAARAACCCASSSVSVRNPPGRFEDSANQRRVSDGAILMREGENESFQEATSDRLGSGAVGRLSTGNHSPAPAEALSCANDRGPETTARANTPTTA